MSYTQHEELLDVLSRIKGKFILSGYHSKLYDSIAEKAGWRVEEFQIKNSAAGGEKKRTMVEVVWRNY